MFQLAMPMNTIITLNVQLIVLLHKNFTQMHLKFLLSLAFYRPSFIQTLQQVINSMFKVHFLSKCFTEQLLKLSGCKLLCELYLELINWGKIYGKFASEPLFIKWNFISCKQHRVHLKYKNYDCLYSIRFFYHYKFNFYNYNIILWTTFNNCCCCFWIFHILNSTN